MAANRNRLDRWLAQTQQRPIKQMRLAVLQGRVRVDGCVAVDPTRLVDQFSRVYLDDTLVQQCAPIYLMLHKPVGVVCATRDDKHRTVLDLIDHPRKYELHIVGRLDLNSSGLVLLTNDGRWSRQLMNPEQKVAKVYRVTVKEPITDDYQVAFERGIYFAYENITTAPVQMLPLSATSVELRLTEGKYHQIKRMFGHFRNTVLSLHRLAIGPYQLPDDLAEGQWREISLPG
ncbi:MAG: 16S rRNA pseudouridine(516) synthase [Reinekea sp.]|nr:16S rRNA pseudouridine(516) synthase [Reinekea sp.]MDX1474705.1 16S rRNA pseudouridine(516) synthase [Reinekea sp.]